MYSLPFGHEDFEFESIQGVSRRSPACAPKLEDVNKQRLMSIHEAIILVIFFFHKLIFFWCIIRALYFEVSKSPHTYMRLLCSLCHEIFVYEGFQ